jgi:hypothetical protein
VANETTVSGIHGNILHIFELSVSLLESHADLCPSRKLLPLQWDHDSNADPT